MKSIILFLFLFNTSIIQASDEASEFLSVAYCTPTQEESAYKSIELFYDDEKKGFYVAELNLPDGFAPIRAGVLVSVKDEGSFLEVESSSIKFSIKKNDKSSTFEIDGAIFSCDRADW